MGQRRGTAAREADTRFRIAEILTNRLNLDVPSPDTDLIAEGLLDSLGFVELLSGLEQEFDVTIPMDELEIEYFRSIDNIAAFIGNGSTSDGLPVRGWPYHAD
jgi:D-alanine--poly(phosphoribitol) ligase subunit 2